MAFYGRTWKTIDGAGLNINQAVYRAGDALDGYGKDAKKHIGSAFADPKKFGQNAGKYIKTAGNNTVSWVSEHPREAAGLAGVVAVPVIAVAAVPAVLGAVGFGSSGVVGGSVASGAQAGIGNVAAGSAFAFFQSAGAGGGALSTLNAAVGTTATALAAGTAASSALNAVKKCDGKDGRTEDDSGNQDENAECVGNGKVKAKL